MKFGIAERLSLLGMQEIPRFGNIVTMGIVSDFFARMNFTVEEIEKWNIEFSTNEETGKSNVSWAPTAPPIADIEITPGMAKIVTAAMERVPEEPGLPIILVPIYREMKAMVPVEEPKK